MPIATRAESQLDDSIRFLGYTVDDAPLAPGDTRRVNLFWQANGQPSADYTAFVQALGRDGAPVAGWEAPPGASYSTSQWAPGTLMRTQATIRFPAGTPDGRYPLIAGLYDPATGARLKTDGGAEQVSLGSVTVKGRAHQMNAPAPQTATDITFGQVARLVGFDQGAAANGAGSIAGYGDAEPGAGAYPTTGWLAGEYLADSHTLTLPASPGKLRLAVGLYDPATGERLLTADGQDQFMIELKD